MGQGCGTWMGIRERWNAKAAGFCVVPNGNCGLRKVKRACALESKGGASSVGHYAQCSCGRLSLTARAEPYAVVVCHCGACRKRTGSVLGAGAYFEQRDVTIQGEARRFERVIEERKFESSFCPDCGASLYWKTDLHPTGIGVALGCFEDPSAFFPSRSVWESRKARWLSVDAAIPGHLEGSRSPSSR